MRIFILVLINLIAFNLSPFEITHGERDIEYRSPETAVCEPGFKLSPGEVAGEMSIPVLDLENAPLYYLPTRENLKNGPCMDGPEGGWQLVGEKGRSMIAAHNDKEFKNLDKMNSGDRVFVSTEYGDFEFQVESVRVYRQNTDDWKETAYEGAEEYGLALVTCYPLNKRNTTGDRLIVRCKRVSAST